jgi:hypothetical protein
MAPAFSGRQGHSWFHPGSPALDDLRIIVRRRQAAGLFLAANGATVSAY